MYFLLMTLLAGPVLPGPSSDSSSFLVATPAGTREYIVRSVPSRHGCTVSILRSFADGGESDRVEFVTKLARGDSLDLREGGNPGEHGNVAATIHCDMNGKVVAKRSPSPETSVAASQSIADDEEE